MKRKTLAVFAASVILASTTAAASPIDASKAYVGAEVGQSSFHHGVNQFKNEGYGIHRNSVTTGVYGGYQLHENVAVEGGYYYLGAAKANVDNRESLKHSAHGAIVDIKASYPVYQDVTVYGKAGVGLIRSDYSYRPDADASKEVKDHRFKPSLVLGAGVDYAITPAVHTNLEYKWVENVGKVTTASQTYRPDMGMVTAGVSYHFSGAPVTNMPETKAFSFNDKVLFDFNKSTLKPEAKEALGTVIDEIKTTKDAEVKVSGFTDRIGSENYNLKLSQDRAETVAGYLNGEAPAVYSANGYGEHTPVTGFTCNKIKSKAKLVECLSPDRRVEVEVTGTK